MAKTKKDKLEYDNGDVRVVLTDAKFRCTKCTKWKPASKFGLRNMSQPEHQPIIRQIPQCKDCRNHKKGE